MKSIKLALIYGLLLWLIPFVTAFIIFPIRESNYPFFETIMPISLTVSCVIFGYLYMVKLESNFVAEGVKLGIIWFIMSVAIDLPMFLWGPMERTFGSYMTDIGLTYLIYPTITIGFGFLRARENK